MFAAALRGTGRHSRRYPPPSHRDRGCRAGRGGAARRLRWRNPPRTRTSAQAPTTSRSPTPSFPTEQRLGQTSLLQLGVRNTGKQDGAGADGDDLDRRQAGRSLVAALRRSATPSPDLAQPDRPVWVLAASYPRLAGSDDPGGATTSNRKTFAFGPLKPGETTRGGLEAERGQSRQVHRALPSRRRPQRRGQGGDRRRRRPRRLLRDRDLRRAAGNRSHRQRRSRRNRRAAQAQRARRATAPRRVALPRMRRARSSPSLVAALLTLRPAGLRRGRSSRSRRRRHASAKGGGVGLKQIGDFDDPVYVTGAPGYPEAALRRRAAGRGSWSCKGGQRRRHLPRPPRRWSATAASAACSRSPSRPTTRRSRRFYVYYTDDAGDIRVDEFKRRSATRAAAGSQRRVIDDPPPGQLQPQRRPAAVPRRPPLLRHRRRRLRRRPAQQRPEQGRACSASCCGSTRGQPAAGPTRSRPRNPFVGKPGRDEIYSYGLRNPFRFSFDTVSARQPRIAIGDVGQNQFEELDYTTVGRRERRQLRLGRPRGLRPLHGRKQRHPRPRRHREADLRLLRTAAAAAARSSAATSSPTAACARSTSATSTPTSARASCAASSPT